MRLWTWLEETGERCYEDIPFQPYVYVESSNNPDAMSIFNTPLKKTTFKNDWDRRKYIKESGLNRVFYNIPVEQQFLIDHFKFQNAEPDFSQFPLKIYYLDIEVFSDSDFPRADEAKHEINVITIYNSIDGLFHTWGTGGKSGGDYIPADNVVYKKCKDEKDLLISFLAYWRKDFADIVTGWNSEGYDIPYIINRLNNVFGENKANLLSPIGEIYCRKDVMTRFGDMQDEWHIMGMSHIDYMRAYKVFERKKREKYSLDHIGNVELGYGKDDIAGCDLHKVADSDWQKYVNYNIQDVNVIVQLEAKKHYLDIIRKLSYMGYTKFEKSLGTISNVTGAVALKALEDGLIIPTFEHKSVSKFEGGFVMEPIRGRTEGVVSFDANSLYPNTMITCNISPETKLGKIISNDNNKVKIKLVNGKTYDMEPAKFMEFVDAEKIAITKAKVLYTQKRKGIFPAFLDKLYQERAATKKKMIKCKKKKDTLSRKLKKLQTQSEIDSYKEQLKKLDTDIVEFDTLQYVLKICLNSVYGVFGNKYAAFYDIDSASSVTLTGQACVKQADVITSKYFKDRGLDKDCTIYQDTDSIYLTIDPLLKLNGHKLQENWIPTKEAYDICTEMEDYINSEITKWAKKSCNSIDPRFVFKRESICNSGVFLEKKKYLLHVLDDEGIQCDKIKITGVEIIKIEIPAKIKPLMTNIVGVMMRTGDYAKTNDEVQKLYDTFMALSPEETSKTVRVGTLSKYMKTSNGLATGKGTPGHVKAAIYYNHLVHEFGLTGKYPIIPEGAHIKFFFAHPNKYNIDKIAFLDKFPEEFGIGMDKKLTFNTNIFPTVQRIYETVGWRPKNPSSGYAVDLFDILS